MGVEASNYDQITQAIAERYEIDLDAAWFDLPGDMQDLFCTAPTGTGPSLPQPDGPQAVLHDVLRGDRPQPRAALRTDSGWSREKIEEYMSVRPPRVQGRAAAARVAGGQGVADLAIHGIPPT